MDKIKNYLFEHRIDLGLTVASIVLTCLMHWLGFFDFLELKTYDYRFNNVRGPLTGWRASDSTITRLGTDVVNKYVAILGIDIVREWWQKEGQKAIIILTLTYFGLI